MILQKVVLLFFIGIKFIQRKMAPKQRMNVANEQFTKNVVKRGNVEKSSKSMEKSRVGPWLIGMFVFVVCGSGKNLSFSYTVY
uniref:Stress-associated endoplasmic reticulum protein n=1 Tax=Panagrolaimus sp. PS1159 TaxID=55785 RepID=A0AC35G7T3_9BILA